MTQTTETQILQLLDESKTKDLIYVNFLANRELEADIITALSSGGESITGTRKGRNRFMVRFGSCGYLCPSSQEHCPPRLIG